MIPNRVADCIPGLAWDRRLRRGLARLVDQMDVVRLFDLARIEGGDGGDSDEGEDGEEATEDEPTEAVAVLLASNVGAEESEDEANRDDEHGGRS